MTPRRLERLEGSLNSLERKVLQGTPMAESWTLQQVCTELRRQGLRNDAPHVQACLTQMVDKGLVRERAGRYSRVPARQVEAGADDDDAAADQATAHTQDAAPSRAMETTMNTPTQGAKVALLPRPERAAAGPVAGAAAPPADCLAALSAVSVQLRALASQLVTAAATLDDHALALAEQLQGLDDQLGQFRQLQVLLKGIGGLGDAAAR